ncbi:3-dehydroquinate synthase [Candidatus Galacturonibacter soehngenii]|uniref:3-dehydroquinate synthase n=1 Tax=Candidatus Galacturonatibacter soehngenii TaxID=2307010 RepID=A0A7V7QM19_9FIRM|nr:3-dehydroquinate synthase [Candidatus Galacturonibacter soehngenii]KAB1439644.1 3-dehydroquinate synthase [Candidatus Galacturonibacter soehngenii]
MGKRLTIHGKTKKVNLYDIVIESSFDQLANELKLFALENRKICIVTDSNVESIYSKQLEEILKEIFSQVVVFTFPAGEENKNLDTVKALYEKLILEKFDRKDMLVALGGGVVGDLTGYAAATYLRGIDFIQIPTTLLSQVDSSIGGKTGVDFDSYKNMVGAFHQPKLVYMNLSVLKSLPEVQYYSGMGEILKHGLIKNEGYYIWLIEHLYEIYEKDMDTLEEMVYESCLIKSAVVEKDPKEEGDRALLNFGHTIGHAIEKLKNFELLHGECVALGSVAAAYISYKKELLTKEEFYEIRDMYVAFHLPITVSGLDANQVLEATKRDKKMDSGQIKFILLKKMGKAIMDQTVTDDEILEAIQFIIFDEDENE